jgi:hypothetical protein
LGFDNINPIYDPSIKRANPRSGDRDLRQRHPFTLIDPKLKDPAAREAAFTAHKLRKVVNLAEQS